MQTRGDRRVHVLYYSINFWYPTFLREAGGRRCRISSRSTSARSAALRRGAGCRKTRLGRRGAATITALLGVASIPLYLHATTPTLLGLGALMMGAFGMRHLGHGAGVRHRAFPTEARGVGPGFCYHAAAAIGSLMPILIGSMRDNGMSLANAMTIPIAVALACSAAFIWLGPETRGRQFTQ